MIMRGDLVIYLAPLLSSLRMSAAAAASAVNVSGPGETAKDNPYNLTYSEKFLAELKFGNPEQKESAYNEDVPMKAPQHTSLLDKQTFVILESSNDTYSDRTVYVSRGANAEIPCLESVEVKGYLKSLRYKWLDSSGVDVKKSKRQPGIAIDERFQLHINDAQLEDTGRYSCVIVAGYIDKADVVTITNTVSLNVYVNPDLALEFPFLFDSTKCDEQRDALQMNKVKNLLCPGSPCVFEFTKTCVVEPWLNHNMPYVPHAMLLIVATKFADPSYKTPACPHDCIMGNKFDHIIANLDIVQKVVEKIPNTTELRFVSSMTMRRKKLIYSCDAGYSLYQEHCVPCFPGTYNPKRRQNFCLPCPVNTYQHFPGTHDCLLCPENKVTRGLLKTNIKDCVNKRVDVFRFRQEFFILSCVIGVFLLLALFIYIAKYWDTLKLKLTWLKPQPEYSKLLKSSQKSEKSQEQPSATATEAAVSVKASKQHLISSKGSYQLVNPPAVTETIQLRKTNRETSDKVTSTGTELPTPKPVPSMTTTTVKSSMPLSTRTSERTFPALPQNVPQNVPVATVPQNVPQNVPVATVPQNVPQNVLVATVPQNVPQGVPVATVPQNVPQGVPVATVPQNVPQGVPVATVPQNVPQNVPMATVPQNVPQNVPVTTAIPTTPATPGLDTNASPLKPAFRVLPSQSLRPSLSTHLPPQLTPVVPVQKSQSQIATAQTSVATLATTAQFPP